MPLRIAHFLFFLFLLPFFLSFFLSLLSRTILTYSLTFSPWSQFRYSTSALLHEAESEDNGLDRRDGGCYYLKRKTSSRACTSSDMLTKLDE